ncbi:MAG: TonB-dependent receptor, partial [Gammaproteobacteria bacterium]
MRQTTSVRAGRARAAVALLTVLCASAASAQDEDLPATIPVEPLDAGDTGTPTAPRRGNDGGEIPEVIVTATKREAPLREIPATIALVDGAALEQRAANGVEDFVRLVPGVNLTAQDVGATKVTIRGISSELGTAATTGVLYGNVSFSDAYFPFVALDPHPFDMQGVEVLKGPQGTLFGASALNGAVRYVPRAPELDAFSVKYYGQYSAIHEGDAAPTYGAAVNLPLRRDEAALRMVALRRETAGYTDDTGRGLDDVNRIEQDALRVLGAWTPGEAWHISAMYVREDSDYADEAFADNRDGELSRNDTPQTSPRQSFYDFYALSVEYRFDWARVVSESAYVRKRFDQNTDISRAFTGPDTSTSSVDTTIFFESDTFSQELRLVSEAGASPWTWVAGVFWSDQPIESGYDIFVDESVPVGSTLESLGAPALPGLPTDAAFSTNGQPLVGRQRSDVAVTELAAFGDVTYALGERWEIGVGLRAYRTTSGGSAVASGALYGGVENANVDEITERGLNPKATLRWHASEELMIYGLVSRGFRVGGIQPTASGLSADIPRFFESDTLWNYEAGVRSSWLDGRLLLDLSAYFIDWNEPVLTQRDESNPNPVAYYYDNVGGAQSSGVEGAMQWRTPLDGLSLNLSASYSRTVTTEPFTASGGDQIEPGTTWPFA